MLQPNRCRGRSCTCPQGNRKGLPLPSLASILIYDDAGWSILLIRIVFYNFRGSSMNLISFMVVPIVVGMLVWSISKYRWTDASSRYWISWWYHRGESVATDCVWDFVGNPGYSYRKPLVLLVLQWVFLKDSSWDQHRNRAWCEASVVINRRSFFPRQGVIIHQKCETSSLSN